MQSVSSRIWTHVAVSTSYDDNHYTTGTSSIAKYTLRFTDGLKLIQNISLINMHILNTYLSLQK